MVIALPEDMLTTLTDAAPLTVPARIAEAAPALAAMEEALALVAGASRPLILIGGCNWTGQSRADLQAFAEASDIPVIRYQDQFDNHSPVYAGEAGVDAIGYHRMEEPIDADAPHRLHGLSKCFVEDLGRLYRDKFEIETAAFFEAPRNERTRLCLSQMLAPWRRRPRNDCTCPLKLVVIVHHPDEPETSESKAGWGTAHERS